MLKLVRSTPVDEDLPPKGLMSGERDLDLVPTRRQSEPLEESVEVVDRASMGAVNEDLSLLA